MDDNARVTRDFVGLWTAHARRVYSYILSLVPNVADAEDIFQETSTTLWEKFDTFRPGSDFAAWACRTAYYKVLTHSKRRGELPLSEAFLAAVSEEVSQMADLLDAQHVALAECLGKLPARDRQLVELRYGPGGSAKTLAAQVGRSVPAIYKALQRIHDALFTCIRRKLAAEERQ